MARASGKVALITGGAGGLGSATARRLAEEGAVIVVADLADEAGKAVAKETGGMFLRLDVTSEDNWRAVVEAVRGEHGRIDVLVNAAGVEGDVINGSIE
jgi:3(or 17)beta-hydroxysteroid dehydrogenase